MATAAMFACAQFIGVRSAPCGSGSEGVSPDVRLRPFFYCSGDSLKELGVNWGTFHSDPIGKFPSFFCDTQ